MDENTKIINYNEKMKQVVDFTGQDLNRTLNINFHHLITELMHIPFKSAGCSSHSGHLT